MNQQTYVASTGNMNIGKVITADQVGFPDSQRTFNRYFRIFQL